MTNPTSIFESVAYYGTLQYAWVRVMRVEAKISLKICEWWLIGVLTSNSASVFNFTYVEIKLLYPGKEMQQSQ